METLTLLTVQLKRQSLTESDDSEPNPFEQNQSSETVQTDGVGSILVSPVHAACSPLQQVEGQGPFCALSLPFLSHQNLPACTFPAAAPAVAPSLSLPPTDPYLHLDLVKVGGGNSIDDELELTLAVAENNRWPSVTAAEVEVGGGSGVKVMGGRKRPLASACSLSLDTITPSSDEEICDLFAIRGGHPQPSHSHQQRSATSISHHEGTSLLAPPPLPAPARSVSPRKRRCSATEGCTRETGVRSWSGERPFLDFEKMQRVHKWASSVNGSSSSGGGGRAKLVKIKACSTLPARGRASGSGGLFDPAVFAFQPISCVAFNSA